MKERVSITLSLGGGGFSGRSWDWGFAEFHQPKLSSDAPVCPNFCLSQIWLDPLICRPWPAYCRLFSPANPSYTSLLPTSMPSFRPSIDLITVLPAFLSPLTQNLPYSQTSPFYRSNISRFKFHILTCSYISILS